jgi:hypothetical protein
MPHTYARGTFIGAAVALMALAQAAPAAQNNPQTNAGGISLSKGGTVPPTANLTPLHLTDAQRTQVRQALAGHQTQVEFTSKKTKPAKDFTPAVGATLPTGVTAQPLPGAVTQKIPQLADYTYVKMKDQVLIVNGMTHKVVDVFPAS